MIEREAQARRVSGYTSGMQSLTSGWNGFGRDRYTQHVRAQRMQAQEIESRAQGFGLEDAYSSESARHGVGCRRPRDTLDFYP